MAKEITLIGRNLRKIRKLKGLSQDRLSKMADISYNTIIKLESGGILNPTIATLRKISRALKISVGQLIK